MMNDKPMCRRAPLVILNGGGKASTLNSASMCRRSEGPIPMIAAGAYW
jgi:hypothetical protein